MTQDEALTILKTGANVFLTGEPGSGKTFTVNAFTQWLRERGVEPAITASTGIAATHIGGYTIHSWSAIGIKKFLTDYDLDKITQNEKAAKRIRRAHTLIIDEASMLSAATLAMAETVCRTVRQDGRPFGGLQVVLVGDFFQLPPVVRASEAAEILAELFERNRNGARFAFDSDVWPKLNPIVCYLSEQYRQEDPEFLELLLALRHSGIRKEHKGLLESRMGYRWDRNSGSAQLFSHNVDVDRMNEAELSRIEGHEHIFEMESRGNRALVENLKRGCLSPERLALKVGARVMFTKNNFDEGFVNGTLGAVVDFSPTIEGGYPIIETWRGLPAQAGDYIVAQPMEWQIEENGRSLAAITQVPLRLAWAMTIHKSQGLSLDAAHIDLSRTFEYGQGYVALSRVRTLQGLTLAGINERVLQVHPQILEKDTEFHAASDAAREAFARIPADEIKKMQARFVKACGGEEPKSNGDRLQNTKSKSKLDMLRETYQNAYRSWSAEDDAELRSLFGDGQTMKELSDHFGRQRGAIRSRLVKLGLIEEDAVVE